MLALVSKVSLGLLARTHAPSVPFWPGHMLGLVQGWESVCRGVLRIPLLNNKEGLRFVVFVCWFIGLKNILCFQKICVTYYQIPISCFLKDIDPISMIRDIFVTRIFIMFRRASFSKIDNMVDSHFFEIAKIMFVKLFQGVLLDFFRCPGVSKDK